MPATDARQAARTLGTGSETLEGSRASYPAIAVNSNAASRTFRAIGPTCANVGVADVGETGTRPNWPLSPTRPVKEDGTRIEPPPSVPNPNGVTPAAMDAAAPALEPPGVLATSQGLPRDSSQWAIADWFAAILAGCRLSDDDSAGGSQSPNRRRVLWRNVAPIRTGA